MLALIITSSLILLITIIVCTYLARSQQRQFQQALEQKLTQLHGERREIQEILQTQQNAANEQRTRFDAHQIKSLELIQSSLHNAAKEMREQLQLALEQNTKATNEQIHRLTCRTQEQLSQISQEVDKQLSKGFEKTTATFQDVLKRLVVIDQAQRKITELSENVVSLQEVLSDKKSRGAFGEVQLNALIRDAIPEKHYSLQHTLSNGKRCDCMLFLPEPTGNVVIDAKFPLEAYQQLQQEITNDKQKSLLQQFKRDIKKHINDISERYIIPGETADGAVLFIPAEAIFAEIHANHPDLVSYAQQKRVWLVSPTTMMAILTTARAVLKDAATRKQVHIIQEHLVALGKDFERFQKRMDNLARHINQAHDDVDLVYKSSKKITSRFDKIERVDMQGEEPSGALSALADDDS